jgi:ATP-dependent helicase/nuclease subunit B
MSRRPLFSIAPHAPFLPTLARAVLAGTIFPDWPRSGPFWLTDITIILPTQRARQALAEAFADQGVGLLPDLRTFGGEAGEEEPFLPPIDAPPLPAAISPLTRRLVLARLVAHWADTPGGRQVLATPPNAAEILNLADSLGTLADDLIIEGVSYAALRQLPAADLAENWQKTLAFLDIALEFWPQWLDGRCLVDAAQRRNARLDRQAATAPLLYHDRPVIAAGSTGSIPATARLMAAIAELPRGALVLPGLDVSLSPGDHKLLLSNDKAPHGHPQYGLMKLLASLGSAVADVVELAQTPSDPRTMAIRAALALPDATAAWPVRRAAIAAELQEAMAGLSTIAARNADEEARAIALLARDALDRGESVGIISPDQTLSRRIAAELGRFDIAVDDAAGTPLFQSAIGRLARLALGVAASGFGPVELIALLANRGVGLGLGRAVVSQLADRLDRGLLRGQMPATGLSGLRRSLAAHMQSERRWLSDADAEGLEALFSQLEAALGPLCNILQSKGFSAAELARSLSQALTGLAAAAPGETMPDIPGAAQFDLWVQTLVEGPDPGPTLPGGTPHEVLSALMAGLSVPEPGRSAYPISLWGQLEARLQNPDLLVLAGLNEDIWPRTADPGPWLSRGMRIAAGLEPPERRQGLAAHDFEMALGNRRAVIAFAQRLGAAPALPSRLVQRIEAFFGDEITRAMRGRGAVWVEMARALDAVEGPPRPATRPAPRPRTGLRPRRLSVTEIERLIRSPYDIHARHVLGLRRLAPLGEMPDARERGALVHQIFARFVIEDGDFAAPEAQARLEAMAEEAFASLDSIGERRDIWLFRFRRAAEQFIAFERERGPRVSRRAAEIDGRWQMPSGFVLTGRADRLDRLAEGSYAILDFKTGTLPTNSEMEDFLTPQLPLEAAMAAAGAFEGHLPAPTADLRYLKIGLGPEALTETEFRRRKGLGMDEAVAEAAHRLVAHVDALLLKDSLPLVAGLLPRAGQRFAGDYDHLARTAEWSAAGGEDDQ